jgi:hypothetical protein
MSCPDPVTLRDEGLTALNERLRDVAERHSARSRAAWLARHPGTLADVVALVRRLPSIDVEVSDTPAGAELAALLTRRAFGVPYARLGRSALVVPPDGTAYWTGRSRQAARTNTARARRAGVDVRAVRVEDVPSLRDAAADADWRGHLDWALTVLDPALPWVALAVVDREGRPVALAAALVDVHTAHLRVHISDHSHPIARDARYLLTGELVGELARRGVRVLLVNSVFGKPESIAYFQHLVGFAPYNLRLRRGRVSQRQPHRAARGKYAGDREPRRT